MELKAFQELVKEQSAQAEAELRTAKEAAAVGSRDLFERSIRRLIRNKYLLEDVPEPEDVLSALSDESTRRVLILTEGNLKAAEISAGCLEADTSEMKVVLLILMLRRSFELNFPPEKTADLETVGELCRFLWGEIISRS